jgi:hypothetical protein
VCECTDVGCIEPVVATGSDYRRVRASEARFLLVPGHEREQAERVVERHEKFVVVEQVDLARPLHGALSGQGESR